MAGLTLTLPPQLVQRDPLEFSDDDFSTFAPHSGHLSSDDEPKCADVGHGYVTDDGEGEEEAGWHQYQQVHDEGNVVMVAFTTEVNDEGMVMMTTLAPEMQNAFTDAYGTDGNTEAIAAYPDIQPYPDIQLNEDDQDDCFAIHSDFVHDIAKKEAEMIQMLRNEDTIEDFNALSMQLHDLWMEITTKSMKSSKTAQWLISAFNDKVLQQIGLSAFDLYLLGQLMQATLPILDQELLRMFLTTYLWQKSDSLTHMAKTEEGTNVLLVALALRQQWTESGQSVEPLLKQLLTFFAQTEKLQETAWLNIPCWRMIVSHILAWKNEQDEGSVVTDLPMLFSWYPENLMERLQVCRNIFQSFKRQEKSIKSLQDYDNIEDTNMFWFAKEIQAAAKAFKDLWWYEDEAKDEWAILILDVTLYYCEDLENSAKVAKNVPLFRSLLMMPHIFRKSTPAMEIKEKLVALGKDILHQMATSDAARIVILNVIRNKHVDSAVLEDFFTISPMSKDLFLRGARFIVCTVLERSKDHHDTWARWLCEEAGLCLHVLAVPLMEILFEQSPSLASVKYLAESFTFISKGVYMIGPDGSLTHCRWEKDFVKSRILLDKSWQKIACLLYHISGPVADHMETLAWRTRHTTIQEAVKAAKDYAMAQEQLHIYE